eukprot:1411932-Rhodomonas_salina.1
MRLEGRCHKCWDSENLKVAAEACPSTGRTQPGTRKQGPLNTIPVASYGLSCYFAVADHSYPG